MSLDRERPADLRSEHERAAELLPWYVNGTLTGAEHELVDRHVRACLPCRSALLAERRLAALLEAQPTVHVSADEGFERLRLRMERPHPARMRQAAWLLAPAAALALAAWLAVRVAEPPAPEIVTLTTGAAASARIDVVFAPAAAETDVRAVIREIGGTIVAGPSDIGRYTVLVPAPASGSDDLQALLERLQSDPRVRFAGRSFDETAP